MLIIWDVGQGQFLTLVSAYECLHIDSGGEFFAQKATLKRLCNYKSNLIAFTHWDWDHINLTPVLKHLFPKLCRLNFSHSLPTSDRKKSLIQGLKVCKHSPKIIIEPLFPRKLRQKIYSLSSNDQSDVFNVEHLFLSPGDSTKKVEKYWAPSLSKTNQIKTLILGHHGSQTSTSTNLLRALPNLTMAICSARKKRYGHPHKRTKKTLKLFRGLRVFCTENFGSIAIKY